MKNKRFKLLCLSFLCFGLILILGFNNYNKEEVKTIDFHGKTIGYSDLKELEKASPVIVRGIKTKENSVEVFKSPVNNEVIGGYTVSSFLISDIYKSDKSNQDIKFEKEIKISEMAFYDNETNAIYTVNEYEKMKIGEEYLLFLVPVDNGMYAPRGVTFGKVPISAPILNKNDEMFKDPEFEVVSEVIREAQVKYKNK